MSFLCCHQCPHFSTGPFYTIFPIKLLCASFLSCGSCMPYPYHLHWFDRCTIELRPQILKLTLYHFLNPPVATSVIATTTFWFLLRKKLEPWNTLVMRSIPSAFFRLLTVPKRDVFKVMSLFFTVLNFWSNVSSVCLALNNRLRCTEKNINCGRYEVGPVVCLFLHFSSHSDQFSLVLWTHLVINYEHDRQLGCHVHLASPLFPVPKPRRFTTIV